MTTDHRDQTGAHSYRRYWLIHREPTLAARRRRFRWDLAAVMFTPALMAASCVLTLLWSVHPVIAAFASGGVFGVCAIIMAVGMMPSHLNQQQ